jgi:[glutamine synthetase] adenylyltransferase / [glutamine synthetase]-adenylyl-L-tyrosine phosphorylase
VASHDDEASFMAALRRFRRRELVRIAWRDLAGRAALPETLGELSALADSAIRAAHDFALRALAPRFGTPRSARASHRNSWCWAWASSAAANSTFLPTST